MTLVEFLKERSTKWHVFREALQVRGGTISITCGHRVRGACGGCYARLFAMFKRIQAQPEVATTITAEIQAVLDEEAAVRLGGRLKR